MRYAGINLATIGIKTYKKQTPSQNKGRQLVENHRKFVKSKEPVTKEANLKKMNSLALSSRKTRKEEDLAKRRGMTVDDSDTSEAEDVEEDIEDEEIDSEDEVSEQ